MKRSLIWMATAATVLVSSSAIAADHTDGSDVTAAPEADINDVYSWVDSDTLKLIMTVHPFADGASAFSDQVQYVFHVGSSAMALAPPMINVTVLCQFDAAQTIQCWVSDGEGAVADYVTGDASASAGISSMSGDTKVFAGLVDDPFFFYLPGFLQARGAVLMAAGGNPPLTFDAGGCPAVDATTATALQELLTGTAMGPATNTFEDLDTLAISMEINKDLFTKGGQQVSVWGSTNNRGN